jgi:hypothetical protein
VRCSTRCARAARPAPGWPRTRQKRRPGARRRRSARCRWGESGGAVGAAGGLELVVGHRLQRFAEADRLLEREILADFDRGGFDFVDGLELLEAGDVGDGLRQVRHLRVELAIDRIEAGGLFRRAVLGGDLGQFATFRLERLNRTIQFGLLRRRYVNGSCHVRPLLKSP